jgi:hypothetical protein
MADVEKSQTRVSPLVSSDVDTSETSLGQVTYRRGWLARLKGQVQDPDELGKELFAKSQQYDEAQLERDAVRVRRKLDFILLPLMCGTYMISFLDKQTYVNSDQR